jgi:hypothetical protein
MNVGDQVTVPFANGTKEGRVVRVSGKSVWLRVDFPRDPLAEKVSGFAWIFQEIPANLSAGNFGSWRASEPRNAEEKPNPRRPKTFFRARTGFPPESCGDDKSFHTTLFLGVVPWL